MAPISLPRMPSWGKPATWLPGVRGPPPSPGLSLWGVAFVGLAHDAPAHGLPDSHRDIMHDVSKAAGKRLTDRSMHNCSGAVWYAHARNDSNRAEP